MTALVFMDTETTGLSLDDDIWEFAAVRREPDGTESSHHAFVEHATKKCAQLPPYFKDDHLSRYEGNNAVTQQVIVRRVARLMDGRPHVVGAVPNFDTERLAKLLRQWGYEPNWHYHLIDVENLAVGYLAAKGIKVAMPWDSDDLTQMLGLDPVPEVERHTAMGDVRWAMRIYDAVMSS